MSKKPTPPSLADLLTATTDIDRKNDLKLSAHIDKIWASLTPREREVLETRFGLNGRTKPAGVVEIERKAARKLKVAEEERERQALFAYMDAANNDELPDGAWWQSLEDAVYEFNDVRGTNFEPNGMVHIWASQHAWNKEGEEEVEKDE